jgi:hypothetical protein
MQTITTIGLDIAKSVFQVHGIDAEDIPTRLPFMAIVASWSAILTRTLRLSLVAMRPSRTGAP